MLLGTVCIANAAYSNTQNTIVKEYLMQDASYSLVGYIRAVAVNHLGEVVNSSLRGFRYSFYAQGSWWYFN